MSGGTAFGGSLRVLVVDDEQLAREELCFQLNQAGDVEIVGQATNGPEALVAADELDPDVVFLDVPMPGLTGYDVARLLRARPHADELTLVALTGWGQSEDKRRTAEAGFDHHLVKPAEPEAILRICREFAKRDSRRPQ